MDTRLFTTGCLLAGAGVALGAFAAHGLRDRLTPDLAALFETGVRYHMYHAIALVAAALAAGRLPSSTLPSLAGWAFALGILLFSGSLYALALTGVRTLGMVTPLGGLAFLIGWALLAVAGWRAS